LKDVEFKMRTGITLEIGPDKVIAFSEKRPGCEEGETAKFSDATLVIAGSNVSIEKQGCQQPNAEV
jgi:hypothetical protein